MLMSVQFPHQLGVAGDTVVSVVDMRRETHRCGFCGSVFVVPPDLWA